MALTIKDPETDRLAQELSELTGAPVSRAVVKALRERLTRERSRADRKKPLREELREIRERCSWLPVLNARAAAEILCFGLLFSYYWREYERSRERTSRACSAQDTG